MTKLCYRFLKIPNKHNSENVRFKKLHLLNKIVSVCIDVNDIKKFDKILTENGEVMLN